MLLSGIYKYKGNTKECKHRNFSLGSTVLSIRILTILKL